MALTEEDKRRVEELFEQLHEHEQKKILSSQQSFEIWLYNTAYSIYCKAKNFLTDFWQFLFG